MHRRTLAMMAGLLLLAVPPAWAEGLDENGEMDAGPPEAASPGPLPLWEAGIAVGFVSVQTYTGASTRKARTLPAPYVVYRGRWLRASGRSVRLVFYERPRLWADLSAGGWIPVSSEDEPARAGMPRRDFTVQAGPRLNYRAWRTARTDTVLRLAVRAVWSVDGWNDTSHRGWIAQPAVAFSFRPWGRLSTGVSLSTLWGDAEQNGYFYNVPAPFATPERPAYRSGAGLVWTALKLSAAWRFNPDLRLGVFVNLKTLEGSVVADSPLVSRRASVSAGAGLVWVFAHSQRTAAGRPPAGR
jgi:outer membrane protein